MSPSPVPSFDLAAWSSTVDASIVTATDLVRLLVFVVVLVGGVLVAASVGALVAQLRGR